VAEKCNWLGMTIYVLIPVFNEAQNIETLRDSIIPVLDKYEAKYVFVDDGSSDNSKGLIREAFYGKNFVVLGDGDNHGPGFSFNIGLNWIIEDSKSDKDAILTMEADNTSDIELLPTMLALNGLGFDLILASIYCQGGGFDNTGLLRKILSFGANFMLRLFFNIKVLTLSSFYRVYSITLLKRIKFNYEELISEKGFISMVEILIKSIKQEAKVIEVPMKLMSSKRKGKSKMKLVSTILSYIRFLHSSALNK
jgi:dolichol-phosphate mannosyltransferase